MTRTKKLLVFALIALTGAIASGAALLEEGNPYAIIVERNVFDLRPPRTPPPRVEPVAPLPTILLTGIFALDDKKQALLKTLATPARPGQAPRKEQYYIIAEGERDGEIEVLKINEEEGVVVVKYEETTLSLSFEENGVKPATKPAPRFLPPLPVPTKPLLRTR